MPCSYYVSSCGVTLELSVTGSVEFRNALMHETFWQEFVPAFHIVNPASVDATWHITEADELLYDFTAKTISATRNATKQVVIVIEAFLELARQQRGVYTMHGATIIQRDAAVGLIGNISGIGKTSLASYASTKGWKWVADDKFAISGTFIVGGTIALLDDHKTRRAAGLQMPQPLTKKCPLRLLCQPIVTNEIELTEFHMDYRKANWTLHEEMTRDIRQVNGIVYPGVAGISSLDNFATEQKRIGAVDRLAKAIPVVYLRGPKDLILKRVTDLIATTS